MALGSREAGPLRVGVNALPLGAGGTGGGTTYLTNLTRCDALGLTDTVTLIVLVEAAEQTTKGGRQ